MRLSILLALIGCLFFTLTAWAKPAGKVVSSEPSASQESKFRNKPAHEEYLKYFEEVYKLMQDHYYFELNRADFERFLKAFDEKIYPSIIMEKKSDTYVRWRSAAYLVDFLKQPDDKFSTFVPPKTTPAGQKFVQEIYGQKQDLGIEGRLIETGYEVDFVEPRSDAYEKGLREHDLIVNLDGQSVVALGLDKIRERFNPVIGTKTKIDYMDAAARLPHEITVESREYFKQTVFLKDTGVPGIFCLSIPKFNEGTPDDATRLISEVASLHPRGLIIDLRGNPGGPPLAARAISGFFLPNGESMVYFEGRHRPRADLDIPVLPPTYRFDWPMVVLVDKGTGSSSELFSGVFQRRKRAVIIGEHTAGQLLLKSIFDMSDGATIAMVTARAHFPDGTPFPIDGVVPDESLNVDKPEEMVSLAAKYLYLKSQGKI